MAGSMAGVVVYPLALMVVSTGSLASAWTAMMLGLGLLYAWTCAPLAAWWAEQFPSQVRYTAVGTVYQLSGVVASGLTPLIATALVVWGGGSLVLVGGYAVAVSGVSLLCAWLLPERRVEHLSPLEREQAGLVTVEVARPAAAEAA